MRLVVLVNVDGKELYAQAGEHVTCESGHRIATLARDVYPSERPSINVFKDWQNTTPPLNKNIIHSVNVLCNICGRPWMFAHSNVTLDQARRGVEYNIVIHFESDGYGDAPAPAEYFGDERWYEQLDGDDE